MRQKTINCVGKQVFKNSDELEKGYVEIELKAYDILREIDSEDVMDYARYSLDMKHEDDFESSLDDFDKDDLIEELESRGHNFSKQIGEEGCIDFLEDSGYTVTTDEDVVGNELDYVDAQLLEAIQKKFINSSWDERLVMHNKIFEI
jgi:hypothetical protein